MRMAAIRVDTLPGNAMHTVTLMSKRSHRGKMWHLLHSLQDFLRRHKTTLEARQQANGFIFIWIELDAAHADFNMTNELM